MLAQQGYVLPLTLSILGLSVMIGQLRDLSCQRLTIDLLDRRAGPRVQLAQPGVHLHIVGRVAQQRMAKAVARIARC